MTLVTGTQLGVLETLEVFHFYEGPKVFMCEGVAGQLYLVFWLGDEAQGVIERWLYVPVSHSRLTLVRSGEVSLREACVSVEGGWVFIGTTGSNPDSVLPLQASDLDPEELPGPQARLALDTPTVPELKESRRQRAVRTQGEVFDLAIKTPGERRSVVAADVLAKTLLETQSTVTALVLANGGYRARTGPVPPELVAEAQLRAVGVFPSSFGIRLESAAFANLLGKSRLADAFDQLFRLLAAGDSEEDLEQLAQEFGGRVMARFTSLMSVVAGHHVDLRMTWASPSSPDERTDLVPWKEADRRVRRLAETVARTSEILEFRSRLDGIDVHRRTFDLLNLEENVRIMGRVADLLLARSAEVSARVPFEYQARVELRQEVNTITAEVRERYLLVDLVPIVDVPEGE